MSQLSKSLALNLVAENKSINSLSVGRSVLCGSDNFSRKKHLWNPGSK